MRRIILLATVALVMTLMMASSALSVPAPFAPPHQHYLTTPNNEKMVRVGPNVCANPNTQQGFNNFHQNVHVNPDHPTDVTREDCPPPA